MTPRRRRRDPPEAAAPLKNLAIALAIQVALLLTFIAIAAEGLFIDDNALLAVVGFIGIVIVFTSIAEIFHNHSEDDRLRRRLHAAETEAARRRPHNQRVG